MRAGQGGEAVGAGRRGGERIVGHRVSPAWMPRPSERGGNAEPTCMFLPPAVFACTACGYACHADVNAARNIAAGHAVTARGRTGPPERVNREPQLVLLPA